MVVGTCRGEHTWDLWETGLSQHSLSMLNLLAALENFTDLEHIAILLSASSCLILQ